jgi:hypothetical protein
MEKLEPQSPNDSRYSALIDLWIHHNSTQFQWPSVILGAIFIAISLLVSEVTVSKIVDVKNWGFDPQVRYGAGLPLLVIGFGTAAMLYTMARARKIMKSLERKLCQIDGSFSELNHPSGPSGAKIIWGFMACLGLIITSLGVFFFFGRQWYITLGWIAILSVWIRLLAYGLK